MSKLLPIFISLVALGVSSVVRADDLNLGEEAAPSAVSWAGDFLLRQDWERSFPGGDNESRLLLRLRYGPSWQINDHWLFGAALRVDESSIGNEHLVDYNDNLRPRDLALDSLYLSYTPVEGDQLLLGKDELPLTLSRMLWDPDLRPAGVSYSDRTRFGDSAELRLAAGAFLVQYLEPDESRLYGAQADLRWNEGSSVQPELTLSYLHFTNLDDLLLAGEDRGNPFTGYAMPGLPPSYPGPGFVFVDQYELADLQFQLHADGELPIRLLLDGDQNLGAVEKYNGSGDRAGRMELAFGDGFHAGGNELGLAMERIQSSAAVGAFNSDEWWFHAGFHGSMLWYAYGWSDRLRLQVSYFHEQPDYSWHHWNRVLLDLQWKL